jgi:two-component system phosphate regulon sensor histidine kinase PhoR
VRFRTPANVLLRRAQLTLILAALVPTILLTPLGILLLASGSSRAVVVVSAVLVLGFCTSAMTGYILGSILLARGASLAKVQNDFLSGVSHELMTPITSVRMFIDTLRAGRITDDAERERCLALIDREMGRLDGLLTKLISLSKLETGKQPFELGAVSVQAIIDEAMVGFETMRMNRPCSLDISVEPDLEITGDRSWMAQAVTNLLSNALKYSPEGNKKISLRAYASGKRHVAIEVADNGPGIPEEEQRRIFDEFERGRAAASGRVTGFGLGLAIVRAIVRQHGGRIELVSLPGEGARFSIILPRRMYALPRRTAEAVT